MEDIKNYTILTLKKMARQNNYTGYTKMNFKIRFIQFFK